MNPPFHFTFKNLAGQYEAAIKAGYEILTCADYAKRKDNLSELTLVNRVDIDFSIEKAAVLGQIFASYQIKATFFVRLHAPDYNPFSFENYKILKRLRDENHEIGYHCEVVDQAAVWGERQEACLRRDLEILSRMLDIKIYGAASHGGSTGLNNLDFWKDRKPSDFGLLYEAYDKSEQFGLFHKSLYLSDSEWTQWKSYHKGALLKGDHRTLEQHLQERPSLVYLLVHPETYSEKVGNQ